MERRRGLEGEIMGLVLDTDLVILRAPALSCPGSSCQHRGGARDWGWVTSPGEILSRNRRGQWKETWR